MKNRKIIVSLIIIAVLLLYLILSKTMNKNSKIPELKKWDKIDEIVITKEDITISLHKKEKDWFINDKYEADAVKVDKLETGMQDLEIIDYISMNHYIKYDLIPEKAIHVVVKNEGNIKRDVLIGKASSTGRSAYIKIADDDGVYLASSNLNTEYSTDVNALREKEIHDIKTSDLIWFQISYKGKSLTFEKKIEEVEESKETEDAPKENAEAEKQKEKKTVENWILKERGNAKINKNKIEPLINAFSTIKAEKFPAIEKKNLKGILCMIKGKTIEKELSLLIHKKHEKEDYLCSSSESQYAFTLQDWAVKRFFKESKDFK